MAAATEKKKKNGAPTKMSEKAKYSTRGLPSKKDREQVDFLGVFSLRHVTKLVMNAYLAKLKTAPKASRHRIHRQNNTEQKELSSTGTMKKEQCAPSLQRQLECVITKENVRGHVRGGKAAVS